MMMLKNKNAPGLVVLLLIWFLLPSCDRSSAIVIPERPYDTLSEYNFFKGLLVNLTPNERVLPYDLNSPLFTDYAEKARFVWMPEGRAATYHPDHVLDFPEETVLIKNFYYDDEGYDKRILETRLLINRGNEWEAVGYIWNDEQTEALREVIGGIKEVNRVTKTGESNTFDYIIPNKNQCKNCHAIGDKQVPIGPKVRHLNKSFAYTEGEMNQLDKWAEVGYLTGYNPGDYHSKAASWDDPESGTIHQRALAYLDINCGHCHNPSGAANTSGLHLVADADVGMSLGIYKATVSAGSGTGGRTYSIVPGHPDESIMVYRMNSTDPAAMMPELGRTQVHEEGVSLIRSWIETLEVEDAHRQATRLQ